jgi:hypothetical protein
MHKHTPIHTSDITAISKLYLMTVIMYYLYPGAKAQKNGENQNCVAPQLRCSRELFSGLP